ncbi:MAG: hypothetical protein RLZZ568_1467 [Cyanobacteriota bacterium]|jgi:hypothetical protein
MQIVLFLSSLLLLWLVLRWIFKVAAATFKTGVIVIALLLLLNLGFGISPAEIGQQIQQFFQGNWQPQR